MATKTLGADSAREKPRSFEQRLAQFKICGVQPFYTADSSPTDEISRNLRQLYALTSVISAGIEGGQVSELNHDILSRAMDAISDQVALIAFWFEEAGNA